MNLLLGTILLLLVLPGKWRARGTRAPQMRVCVGCVGSGGRFFHGKALTQRPRQVFTPERGQASREGPLWDVRGASRGEQSRGFRCWGLF